MHRGPCWRLLTEGRSAPCGDAASQRTTCFAKGMPKRRLTVVWRQKTWQVPGRPFFEFLDRRPASPRHRPSYPLPNDLTATGAGISIRSAGAGRFLRAARGRQHEAGCLAAVVWVDGKTENSVVTARPAYATPKATSSRLFDATACCIRHKQTRSADSRKSHRNRTIRRAMPSESMCHESNAVTGRRAELALS